MSNVTRMPNVSSQNWPQQNWSPSWPPSCSCGCNPCQCGGGWGGMSGLMQCWQDIAQFQQFLQCMLSQMGPIPLQGVTDGSDAKAGQIGEWIQMIQNFTVPITDQTITLSMGVLSPGDWTCFGHGFCSVQILALNFALVPQPTGFSNNMGGGVGSPAVSVSIPSATARASLTVPTLVPFQITTYPVTTGPVAGAGQFIFAARRDR